MATIPEAEVKKLVSRPQKIHVVPIKGYSALVYRDQTGEAHLGFQYLVQDSPVPEGSTGEAIACIIALKDHSSIQALPNDLLPFHYPNSHGDRLFLLPCVETEISIWDAEENDDDIEFLPMRELMNLDPPLAPGLPDLRDAIINIFADPIFDLSSTLTKCETCRSLGPSGSSCNVCMKLRTSIMRPYATQGHL